MADLPSMPNMLTATYMPWIYVCREPTQRLLHNPHCMAVQRVPAIIKSAKSRESATSLRAEAWKGVLSVSGCNALPIL